MGKDKQLLGVSKISIKNILRDYSIYFIMAGIYVIFVIFLHDKGFLSIVNVMNIFRQTALITILAVGFTYLLAGGEFDFSIGSIVALCALIGAIILRKAGIAAAISVSLATGITIGAINGAIVAKAKVPSFLVTIATSSIIYGFARWITNLKSISITNERFIFIFGGGNVGPISTLFIWTIIAVSMGQLIISKTSFGRRTLAVGGNKIAAAFSGINFTNIKWLLFIIMGAVSALVGLLYSGRLAAARYTYGSEDIFTVMAAVVIGGNSIYGGKGNVFGTLIGSVIIGMINNGLILFGFTIDQQIIFKGLIILIAVSLSPKE